MAERGKGKGIEFLREHVNDPDGPCLIWPMFRDPDTGYGRLGFEGEHIYAHRKMCEMVNGPAPSPKHQATHNCGKGDEGCIHPRHLEWKTNQQNQMDREKHGTWRPKGVKFKLTPEIVAEIRAIGDTETKKALAQRFETSRDTIAKILDGRAWATPGQYPKGGFAPGDPRNPSFKLRGKRLGKGPTPLAQRIIAIFDADQDKTLLAIAALAGCAHGTVWRVLNSNGRALVHPPGRRRKAVDQQTAMDSK